MTPRPLWLRPLASGAVFGAIIGASSLITGCKCPDSTTRRHLTDADLARLAPAGETTLPAALCDVECRIDDPLFTPDAMPWRFSTPTCTIDRSPLPQLVCHFDQNCPGGRAPSTGTGAWMTALETEADVVAELARKEWSSVFAFEELAAALDAAHAPASFVRSARCAAEDERRHANAMVALAVALGRPAPILAAPPAGSLDLDALLALNAVEGCVRETYGAAVAAHQGEFAERADVRRVFGKVARDEARHAELSFALHDFALERASHAGRRRLEATRRDALRALVRDVDEDRPAPWSEPLGFPGRARAVAMARSIEA